MSVVPSQSQLYAVDYGRIVTGGAKTLPATTTGHLFTVAGGRVVLTSLIGVVSTAIQAQACTISIGNTPTVGSASVNSIATASASVASLALGQQLMVQPDTPGPPPAPAALIFTGTHGVIAGADLGVIMQSGGICLVPAGQIDWTTSATNTGAVTWTLCYFPYDQGALVTAL